MNETLTDDAATIYALAYKTTPEEPVEERERWYNATSCNDPDCQTCAYRRGHMFGLPPLTDEQKAAMREPYKEHEEIV